MQALQIREQAIEFSPGHAAAFAHALFKLGAIQYLDVPMTGPDQPGIQKFQHGFRRARSPESCCRSALPSHQAFSPE
ncbi:TPA: hypothetical protein QDC02_001279 [Burkholderia stabilis]|nr:hypothetical protein [Burkholderia stabilis]